MVGTLEQAIEALEMVRKPPVPTDDLNSLDRSILGRNGRIEIPLTDRRTYVAQADLLLGFCNAVEFHGQNHELPHRTALFTIRLEMHNLNTKIRELTGERTLGGRMPDSRMRGLLSGDTPKPRHKPQMTYIDRLIAGRNGRIEIPFTDRQHWAALAGLLREFATQLRFHAANPHLTRDAALFSIRMELNALNVEIRKLTGASTLGGRPPGGRMITITVAPDEKTMGGETLPVVVKKYIR